MPRPGAQVMRRALALVSTSLWAFLACANVIAAETDSPEAIRSLELKEEVGELPEGRFDRLTDKLFPISRPHMGGDISFKKLSDWEHRVSAEQARFFGRGSRADFESNTRKRRKSLFHRPRPVDGTGENRTIRQHAESVNECNNGLPNPVSLVERNR